MKNKRKNGKRRQTAWYEAELRKCGRVLKDLERVERDARGNTWEKRNGSIIVMRNSMAICIVDGD